MNWAYPGGPIARTTALTAKPKPKAKPERKTNRERTGPTDAAPTAKPKPKAKHERKTNRVHIQK